MTGLAVNPTELIEIGYVENYDWLLLIHCLKIAVFMNLMLLCSDSLKSTT